MLSLPVETEAEESVCLEQSERKKGQLSSHLNPCPHPINLSATATLKMTCIP